MALNEIGAWFTTSRALDWDAARQTIDRLDADALWGHPQSEELFDWEMIEVNCAGELPRDPTPWDMLPILQEELRGYVDLLEAATAHPTPVTMPDSPEWHFDEMYSYGHALLAAGGTAQDLGAVVESDGTVFFTISAAVESVAVDVTYWDACSAIWMLGAAGVLAAAGADRWVE